ncbi:MAG: hypothetical protein WCX61_02025 [Candidatus Peribacteraceae bacterium]|jgi:hypothetical protein
MNTTILILLSGALLFACGTLLLVLREESKLKKLVWAEQEKTRTFARTFHQLDDLLTGVKWHTEMLVEKEAGTLNIAQQQLIHKIDTCVEDAIALLQKHFKRSRKDYGKSGALRKEEMPAQE